MKKDLNVSLTRIDMLGEDKNSILKAKFIFKNQFEDDKQRTVMYFLVQTAQERGKVNTQ